MQFKAVGMGKIEQSADDHVGPVGGQAHVVDHPAENGVRGLAYPLREIIEVHQEDLERVLHLVGHPGGHPSDDFHFFGLDEL